MSSPPSSSSSSTSSTSLSPPSTSSSSPSSQKGSWQVWLTSGAVAGIACDCVLYPLDTIKTRMQSRAGFFGSGGFHQLFRGVGSAALGSAPSAALFFSTYEGSKKFLTTYTQAQEENIGIHCVSAGMAEVMACIVRVPTENVKQKVQAGLFPSSLKAFQALWNNNANFTQTATTTTTTMTHAATPTSAPPTSRFHLFYRGFFATIMREIPFAFIQFPLYEKGKILGAQFKHNYALKHSASSTSASTSSSSSSSAPSISPAPLSSFECACVGSVSGGIAAACTTPLDVVKTRLMLSSQTSHITSQGVYTSSSLSIPSILSSLYKEGGMTVLFSGVVPRVTWISMGGFVFFGAYEKASKHLTPLFL